MLALLDQIEPIVADAEEAEIARQAADRLETLAGSGAAIELVARERPSVVVKLPAPAIRLILDIMRAMGEGQAFSVLPFAAELTTQQAADFLNVSRPFVVALIDEGKLPARRVGRHRRIKFGDLVAYEKSAMVKQKAALDEMAKLSQELGLE